MLRRQAATSVVLHLLGGGHRRVAAIGIVRRGDRLRQASNGKVIHVLRTQFIGIVRVLHVGMGATRTGSRRVDGGNAVLGATEPSQQVIIVANRARAGDGGEYLTIGIIGEGIGAAFGVYRLRHAPQVIVTGRGRDRGDGVGRLVGGGYAGWEAQRVVEYRLLFDQFAA